MAMQPDSFKRHRFAPGAIGLTPWPQFLFALRFPGIVEIPAKAYRAEDARLCMTLSTYRLPAQQPAMPDLV